MLRFGWLLSAWKIRYTGRREKSKNRSHFLRHALLLTQIIIAQKTHKFYCHADHSSYSGSNGGGRLRVVNLEMV